ncbi:MAG: 30S ribosome-binding factor RbfA [Clostridiales Family XIII bacterium]|jgi:phosphoesterase RecJ-like protein|nr:30S ribosome-binding factor RbfA [Clostridiales Family XIII bacterium]
MRKKHRGERLGEEIRRILSELLLRQLKDPAFDGMISISHVKAADDGSFATVYFTSLGTDAEEVVEGFEKAKGLIRSEVGRRLALRRTPDFRFVPDTAEDYARHIDELIQDLGIPSGDEAAEPAGELTTIEGAAAVLDAYDRVFAFTHIHMDGDTLGAAVALALTLREIGKEAWVVAGEKPPRTIAFIDYGCVIDGVRALEIAAGDERPYLAVAVDYDDISRLEGREALFEGAAETLLFDHHVTSRPSCVYNCIDAAASATAEIVYQCIESAALPMNEDIATALYVGIVTDTGKFQYSNTTPATHRIAAALMEAGADAADVYSRIYQSIKPEKLFVEREMLNTLELFADGRAALSFVTQGMLANVETGDDETDGMSEKLRSILGVEVSVFLKERPDGKVKASLRSKSYYDVSALAADFGGGGHIRAAGFTSDLPMDEVVVTVKEKLAAALQTRE